MPLCVRIDADDLFSKGCLLKDGWREIEVLEVWVGQASIQHALVDHTIEMASRTALDQCLWIASTSFAHDRLHKDPDVPDAVADRAKMMRVEEAFGRATEAVYVVHQGASIHGFCIVSADHDYCTIELIAVDRRHRRKGIAQALIGHIAFEYLPLPILAGTQSTNKEAKRLYESCGLECRATYRTFHK